MKIFLQKYASKESVNQDSGLHINLGNERKLISQDSFDKTFSLAEQYQSERDNCTKIRLICDINVVASNVLHNKITEIVKDEGSENVKLLNYKTDGIDFSNVINKVNGSDVDFWGDNACLEAIRDTQLSNSLCGFEYHCGENIFNNHLLRSQVFRPVCYSTNDSDDFNTIKDYLRHEFDDENGSNAIEELIPFPVSAGITDNTKDILSHLYKYDDILTFSDALSNKMIKTFNGWYGFDNTATMLTYDDENLTNPLYINKVINSANSGDFIDLYPGRDLYSFCPKYNKFRHRLEKNWNYCLTYPSSSTTDMSFIDHGIDENGRDINALKAVYFDDNTQSDNGASQIVIYSISKHGLQEGDYVNVYSTVNSSSTIVLESAQVSTIVDDYIFTLNGQGERISTQWIEVGDDKTIENEGVTYHVSSDKKYIYSTERYYIVNGYANIDPTCQHISYKKISGELTCNYYVRIFSKLPNFKYAKSAVSEYELYKSGSTLISDCQTVETEFENHPSRLAFAQNAYTDKVGEVVFTDDIDINYLKDNLGRPLTSIYLTLLKNNAGYREWYGIGKKIDITSEEIEFSHCFGKLNCGFMESEDALSIEDANDVSILKMNNIDNCQGLNTEDINGISKLDDDEISYKDDKMFYGDLVMYDPMNCLETVIQPILCRFNTAQRELGTLINPAFTSYTYDDIVSDDLDYDGFNIEDSNTIDTVATHKEGYYYMPHYEIPIRTFAPASTLYPSFLTIRSFVKSDDTYDIYTLEKHYFNVGNKAILYNGKTLETFYGVVTAVINANKFSCKFYDKDGNISTSSGIPALLTASMDEKYQYKLFKRDALDIPDYATMLEDGSCRYIWREVLQNGNDQDSDIEEYPFTNGAFYIHKHIDLFVRRQDPNGDYGLQSSDDPEGSTTSVLYNNDYVEESDIKC